MEKDYGLLSKKEFEGLTKEELYKAKEYYLEYKNDASEITKDKSSKSDAITDAYNDMHYAQEKLDIIDKLLDEENPTLK